MVGNRIMVLRQWRGLTREQLAREARISKDYLQRIESGHTRPHIKTIARIAEILEVELGAIMDHVEE